MSNTKALENVSNVIHITTRHEPYCEFCEYEGKPEKLYSFDAAINHYIEKHGYRVLHIGSENTLEDSTGEFITSTVAVVGK